MSSQTNQIQFPSLTRKNIFYCLSKSYNEYNTYPRGNDSVSQHATEFDTLGDGCTQHTPNTPIRREHAKDYLESLTAILHTLDNDERELLAYAMNCTHYLPSAEQIEFSQKIRHGEKDEAKPRHFSIELMTVTTSSSKRHDKRFDEIRSHHDGSLGATIGILLNGRGMSDLYTLACYAGTVAKTLDREYSLDSYMERLNDNGRRVCGLAQTIHNYTQAFRTMQHLEQNGRNLRAIRTTEEPAAAE